MASEDQVRRYLAYWFQLGKKVVIKGGREALLPQPVISGDRYSDEFEECWQRITAPDAGDCHLEATNQTIAELLSSQWDVQPCARCEMPVPQIDLGMTDLSCPCGDLPFWPDNEHPRPRSPINNQSQLAQIRDRLLRTSKLSSD